MAILTSPAFTDTFLRYRVSTHHRPKVVGAVNIVTPIRTNTCEAQVREAVIMRIVIVGAGIPAPRTGVHLLKEISQ